MPLPKLERKQKLPPQPTTQKNIRRIMMKIPWIKVLIPIISAGILTLVIYNVTPPKSLQEIAPDQIILFFGPLLVLLVSLTNLLVRFLPKSIVVSLGILALLIIKALDLFTLLNIVGIIVVTALVFRIIKKSSDPKIPNRIPRVSHLKKQ